MILQMIKFNNTNKIQIVIEPLNRIWGFTEQIQIKNSL